MNKVNKIYDNDNHVHKKTDTVDTHKNHKGHQAHQNHKDHGSETKMKHENHQEHKSHDHSSHISDFKKRFFVSLILTIPVLLLSETIQLWLNFEITFNLQRELVFGLSSLIYFYGGWPFLKGLFSEIKKKLPGMMTLIAMAISVAFIYSAATVFFIEGVDFFWELATLIDVMLLGHWVEAKSIMGASRALEELVKIMPTTAHLIKDGEVIDISVSELKINDDMVIGGSINSEGILHVKITKTGEENYLAQVIDLVRKAQMSKSKTQDLANRAAALLFYVALIAGIITYTTWFLIGFPDFALERAVTVLVIACPHALGLAIPLVVALSTSITAKSGVLIRDRTGFENVRNIDAIVFDKTGTLTEGNFGVTDVISYIPEEELLELTAALEINSEHIIAW